MPPRDVVNSMLRPAGMLVPENAGRRTLIAGFGPIEAQVMKRGIIAEATCISKPFTIIPMVFTARRATSQPGECDPPITLVPVRDRFWRRARVPIRIARVFYEPSQPSFNQIESGVRSQFAFSQPRLTEKTNGNA